VSSWMNSTARYNANTATIRSAVRSRTSVASTLKTKAVHPASADASMSGQYTRGSGLNHADGIARIAAAIFRESGVAWVAAAVAPGAIT